LRYGFQTKNTKIRMEIFSISHSKEKKSLELYNYIQEGSKDICENYLFPKTANISKSKLNIFDTKIQG
jgi:hypothetical protein